GVGFRGVKKRGISPGSVGVERSPRSTWSRDSLFLPGAAGKKKERKGAKSRKAANRGIHFVKWIRLAKERPMLVSRSADSLVRGLLKGDSRTRLSDKAVRAPNRGSIRVPAPRITPHTGVLYPLARTLALRAE